MKLKGFNLTNSSTKNKRRDLDFYPTPPEATHALMLFLDMDPCVVWEPACGDGAMSKIIAEYGHRVISSDLRETGFGEGGIDFLEEKRKCDAIITNPPFKESPKFIVHAVKQARIVAMLLKSQYWHAQIRSELFENYPPSYILALTWRPDFTRGERGGAPTMEVHWDVWIDGDKNTKYRLLKKG